MFDNVGKNNDAEAAKRRVASIIIAAGVVGLISGSVFLYGLFAVVKKVQEVVQKDDMVEVVIDDPIPEEAPPPPPPPPPPASSAPHQDEVKPDPEEMQDEIKPLDTTVKEEIKSDVPSGGDPAGVVGGVEGGVEGGVVGGVVGGVIGGQLGGYRTFHHSEVQFKSKIVPEYPEAAKSMNLGDVDCRVKIYIDEKGMPADVEFMACPKVFQDAARDAVMKSRWYPAKVGTEKVKAQFLLIYQFKLT